MSKTVVPQDYKSLLGLYDTQKAIGLIKTIFQEKLSLALHLNRVTAPLFVPQGSGLNDDLNGVERPVQFDVPCLDDHAEVVHSLAKWKRYALYKYGYRPGQGLVTDMNAIRRDEELDNLHSIYVDQWDWERVITKENRTLEFLQETVCDIVDAVCATSDELRWKFPALKVIRLNRDVTFFTSQELEDLYPNKTPKERENIITRAHGTVCIMQIGGKLKSGEKHDGRAPDYDDWTLNCDILFWHKTLECALELSSMGIRVDAEAMRRQLAEAGCPERAELPFHKLLLDGTLPLTMGGGIGQSRLCMLLLGKAHIGEVQVSLWDDATSEICRKNQIELL
ncbi:aspartate--ammonia ligase [uncultured Gemmiger sp.]|uniref:aspartate--ammonia ligase n=1 Tax=uncultured Gemmiger sp. TaxID=1623490 RepID=UPI0027DB54C5|nr:aspartate--ammonia ligase [uncultured Gemmiger sp.]